MAKNNSSSRRAMGSAVALTPNPPSSGLAPAWRFRPSFHSGPSLRRLREPLMSNVRRQMTFRLSWSGLPFVAAAAAAMWGSACAAEEPHVFPQGLQRDVRDAPLPTRVCPSDTAVQCATEFYKLADDQLNVVYSAARSRLKALGLTREEHNLVRAQRTWVQFRNAHCTYAGEYMTPGTGLKSFFAIACMEVETIRRTYYLQPYSR